MVNFALHYCVEVSQLECRKKLAQKIEYFWIFYTFSKFHLL
mgnify:CR=1 FL=1